MRRPGGFRLAPGERHVLVVRRHWWFLVRPALPILILVGLFMVAVVLGTIVGIGSPWLGLLATVDILVVLVLALLWFGKTLMPWYNDVSIITNQRVLEQSGLVRLRRREAAIARLNESNYTISGVAARFFDYGDLSMVTSGAQGSIMFRQVAHPRRLQALLAEYARAAREEARRLAPPPPPASSVHLQRIMQGADAARPYEMTERVPIIAPLAARIQSRLNLMPHEVAMRAVRQHPIVLIRRIGLPVLVLLALLVAPFLWTTDTWATATLTVGLVIVLWVGWQIVKWANDLYIVTTERLIELERTPVLFEMRNVVQLRSIQDIILYISSAGNRLLDMGDLVVETGGGKDLKLRAVARPEDLQSFIFEQIEALRRREKARDAEQLATTLSEWFREYHRLQGDP